MRFGEAGDRPPGPDDWIPGGFREYAGAEGPLAKPGRHAPAPGIDRRIKQRDCGGHGRSTRARKPSTRRSRSGRPSTPVSAASSSSARSTKAKRQQNRPAVRTRQWTITPKDGQPCGFAFVCRAHGHNRIQLCFGFGVKGRDVHDVVEGAWPSHGTTGTFRQIRRCHDLASSAIGPELLARCAPVLVGRPTARSSVRRHTE